jgi:hypothetical protein
MRSVQCSDDLLTHRFAWGGISFCVPEAWELSAFKSAGASTHIEMEDACGPRMEAEWMRLPGKFNAAAIQARCVKAASRLAQKAKASRELRDLPSGWSATVYSFADGRSLVAAVDIVPASKMFFTFLLYFDPTPKKRSQRNKHDNPQTVLQILTDSLKVHSEPIIPWECYDLKFKLNAGFALIETTFLSGRKSMVFQWRQRRLYVWLFSLADLALKGRPLNAFAAEFLKGIKGLRGPRFIAKPDGSVEAKRRALFPLGHSDQIGRLCFRYKVGFTQLKDRNQIFLWVFHYRKNDDLKMLEGFECSAGALPASEQQHG